VSIIRTIYINERSRIIGYHDSEIDRYDTRARMRAIMDACNDLVTAPEAPHPTHTPPHTFFGVPTGVDGCACAR